MLNKEKTYKGNLNISEKNVSIETDNTWQGIEIEFSGKIAIQSLLSNDYIVKAGFNKIIIIKMNKTTEPISDLFSYRGRADITKCRIITPELESLYLYVNKHSVQLWNTLMKSERSGSTDGIPQDWAYLGENWEDLAFNGNNIKEYYTYRKTTYDKESNTYTEIKELRKK